MESALAQVPVEVRPPRLWLRLTLLGAFGLLASAPFFAHLIGGMIERSGKAPRFPLPALLALQTLQTLLFVALASWGGAKLAPRVGLDAPVLRGAGRLRGVPLAVALGTLATLAMLAVERGFKPFLPEAMRAVQPALGGPLLGFSASFYGGILEELFLRWGVLTLLAFALVKAKLPRAPALIAANLLAALLFGAGHLPAALQLGVPLSAPVITYVVVVNAVGGLVFGWLFIKRGLENAMIAHFTADLWLHVVIAAL